MTRLRALAAVLGFGGFGVFGAAFLLSFLRPAAVESLLAEVVRIEVEREVGAALATPAAGALTRLARDWLNRNVEGAARAGHLSAAMRARIARVSAEMRDPSCACRSPVEGILDARAGIMERANARLTELVRSRYRDAAARLLREFRIFTGANALVMLLLGIAVVARPAARVHLVPPALILAASSGGVAWIYLFEQRWLHTIVFGGYVGMAYFAWLGGAALLLGDILLNRARVTAHLLNFVSNALGATISAAPC